MAGPVGSYVGAAINKPAPIPGGSVLSGSVASGTLGTYEISSGTVVSRAAQLAPIYSGSSLSLITEETVSGIRAVQITNSGGIRVAMAAVSGRMPAIGVVADNVLSGIQCTVLLGGIVGGSSGMVGSLADYSGFLGKSIWVGRSGHVTTVSGSFSSGGIGGTAAAGSGDIGQKVGLLCGSGVLMIHLDLTLWSGGPIGEDTVDAIGLL